MHGVHAADLRAAPGAGLDSASSAPPSATEDRALGPLDRPDARAPSATAPAGTARSGYSPVCWGTSDPYWNDTDYRWYDDAGDDDDDDDGGGFGDS